MGKDDATKVDEESREQLDQVRKGKPRKFVMVIKGTTIVNLVVYKKGTVEKFKKQAKEAGTGTIYYGIVDGRGPEIVFNLAIADGFDKEPVKPPVLKSYLEEAADFKAKPTFAIVKAHEPLLDGDDPLVQRYLKLKEAAGVAGTTYPDRAGELSGLCRQIAVDLEADEPEPAVEKLNALESLLGNLSGGTTSDAGTSEGDSLLKTLNDAMKKLTEQVQNALKQFPEKKGELLGAVGTFKERSKALDAAGAQTAFLEVGRLLKELRGSTTSGGDPMAVWRDAKEACDVGISALQIELKNFDDPDLNRIAEFGLNGLTDGMQTRLMIAIMDLQSATGDQRVKAAQTLATRAAELRKSLDADPIVALCESNPFGIAVSIRKPLGDALVELERLANAA